MTTLTCPSCSTKVEVAQGATPVCPSCGFTKTQPKLLRCQTCDGPVSSEAAACPQCGQPASLNEAPPSTGQGSTTSQQWPESGALKPEPAEPELRSAGTLFAMFWAFSGGLFGVFMSLFAMGYPAGMIAGIVFGLLFSAIMTPIMADKKVMAPRTMGADRLIQFMISKNYTLESQGERRWTFKPTAAAGVMSPRINMVERNEYFVVVGPGRIVSKIPTSLE